MLKRRNAVLAFLLVAVMLLGVGFAALSNELSIGGTANATQAQLDATFKDQIGFSSFVADTCNAATVTSNTDFTDLPDAVSFTATGFTQNGDYVTAKFTITNNHPDLAATIPSTLTATVGGDEARYFSATATPSATTINADGGTATVTVVVTMEHTPIDDADATITVSFNAEAVDPMPANND